MVRQLAELHEMLVVLDADGLEGRAAVVLRGLGFSAEGLHAPTSELSGGWRMRTALARALVVEHDVVSRPQGMGGGHIPSSSKESDGHLPSPSSSHSYLASSAPSSLRDGGWLPPFSYYYSSLRDEGNGHLPPYSYSSQ